MKYQVQISYTNPAHEHVTLRRRVETITRLVEASTEGEALNRAANQQRALGFQIKEAKVLQPLQPTSLNEEVEQVDEVKGDPGKALAKSIASRVNKHTGNDSKSQDAVKVTSHEDEHFVHQRYDDDGSQFHTSIRHNDGKFTVSHETPHSNGSKTFSSAEDAANHAHKLWTEEVEQVDESNMQFDADKRDAGYKMSPAVRKAQAESDRLSKVVKPVQAGTLAAQRRRAEMKKEAVDLSEKEVINNKKSKAADTAKKMVNAAKGKMNKINLDPKVDTDSQKTKA